MIFESNICNRASFRSPSYFKQRSRIRRASKCDPMTQLRHSKSLDTDLHNHRLLNMFGHRSSLVHRRLFGSDWMWTSMNWSNRIEWMNQSRTERTERERRQIFARSYTLTVTIGTITVRFHGGGRSLMHLLSNKPMSPNVFDFAAVTFDANSCKHIRLPCLRHRSTIYQHWLVLD